MSEGRLLGWFVECHHQWDSFTPDCNWRDFTLVSLGGEWSQLTGRIEVTACLLGLSVTVTYVYEETAFIRDAKAMRDDYRLIP